MSTDSGACDYCYQYYFDILGEHFDGYVTILRCVNCSTLKFDFNGFDLWED